MFRVIYNVLNDDFFCFGFKRFGDILMIIRDVGKELEFMENMDLFRVFFKEDKFFSKFFEVLIKVVKGEEVSVEFLVKEMNEVLEVFKG